MFKFLYYSLITENKYLNYEQFFYKNIHNKIACKCFLDFSYIVAPGKNSLYTVNLTKCTTYITDIKVREMQQF